MNRLLVYVIRVILAGLGSFAVMRYSYRDVNVAPASYAVVCGLLACFALIGCLLRWRSVRPVEFLSSSCIAFLLTIGSILLSERTSFVDGLPWQAFYKDDYIVAFSVIAPLTAGLLSGLLSMIPESSVAKP